MTMTECVLTVTITIQIPVPPMPPAPAGVKKPEPVFTKEPPVCRCHVRYGNNAA